MRYLLYSHDGFGLGHTRRHLAIARALTQLDPQASVLLASGSEEAYRFGIPPRVEVLKLPALRKIKNGHYVSRRLNIPSQQVLKLRSELLTSSIDAYRPSVVLVDKHPFGVCGEFRPALNAARHVGARTVFGLRDILDEPAAVLREWAEHREEMATLFDLVLVYGQRCVFDPVVEYEFPSALAARTRFCGYVLNEEEFTRKGESSTDSHPRPLVVATAGGGEDGFALLEVFIRSAAGASWHGLAVAGPMMPDAQYSALEAIIGARVSLRRFIPNVHHLFRTSDVLVCMGGYNTLVEAAATRVPTVCVPRLAPRLEQTLRAHAFEKLGLLRTISPGELTPERLRHAVDAALHCKRGSAQGKRVLEFDGAMNAALHMRELARTRDGRNALRESTAA